MYVRWGFSLVVAVAALAGVACGSGGDDGGGGDFAISLGASEVTVPRAGSKVIPIVITPTGDVGSITLAASATGGAVTIEFAPNPVPAGTTASQMTIHAGGSAARGATSLTITATSGAIQHTATLSVTVTGALITGTVSTKLAGVTVGIIGKGSVTSGDGGVFTFSDVAVPYDLYTLSDSTIGGLQHNVIVYQGLTRADPTIQTTPPEVLSSGGCDHCQTQVSGAKTGAGTNTDPVLFRFSGGTLSNATLAANGTYAGNITWFNEGPVNGFISALQFTRRPSQAPDTFLGYARSPVTTLNNGVPAAIDLVFAPVASSTMLNGAISLPPGHHVSQIILRQQIDNISFELWRTSGTTVLAASLPLVPGLGATTLFVESIGNGSRSSYFKSFTGGLSLDIEMAPPPALAQPADTATGVTSSTKFTWTPTPSTLNELDIFSLSGSTAVSYRIVTSSGEVTIPSLPELALPANVDFSWSVFGMSQYATTDDFARINEDAPLQVQTTSATRTFTTAP